MYDPPGYLWVMMIGGITAIAVLTSLSTLVRSPRPAPSAAAATTATLTAGAR